jgi:hypothetical protein
VCQFLLFLNVKWYFNKLSDILTSYAETHQTQCFILGFFKNSDMESCISSFIFYRTETTRKHAASYVCIPCCSQLLTSLEQIVIILHKVDSQQVVPTSLISSARNKLLTSWWQQARSNLLRTALRISLVGTTCCESVTVINLVTRW